MNVQKWVNGRATIQIYTSYISRAATPLRLRGAVARMRHFVFSRFVLPCTLALSHRHITANVNALTHEIRIAEMAGRDFHAAALCLRRAWMLACLGVWRVFSHGAEEGT